MVKKTLELKDLAAGESYAVQVRALGDGEDNVDSPWSLTLNFTTDKDEVAPREPNNLSVAVDGSSFVGTWTQPTENEDGSNIQDLKDYEVTVRDVDNGGTQVYYTTNQRFEFTAEMNHAVFGTNASGVTGVPGFLSKTIEFSVKSRDLAHNTSTTPAVDQATNGAPSAFTLTNNEADSPLTSSLSWDAADGNDLLVYRVRRGISTGTYDTNKITTDTHFTESNLSRGDYFYLVEAYDKFGNMTASNEVTVTVVGFWEADFAVPDAPTISNVASTFDGDTQSAELTFDVTGPSTADSGAVADYDYHSHYVVRWSTSATGPFQYQTIDESDNTATHEVSIQGLKPNTEYFYGVKSVSEYGQSGAYQTGSITTAVDSTPPAAPANLSAAGSLKNITVSWDANSEPDLAKYELYANQTSGFDPLVDGTKVYTGNGTGFAHSVGDSEQWYYKVRAIDNSDNESGFSTQATATSTDPAGQEDTDPPSDVTGVAVNAQTYYHGSSERAYADVSWTAATDDTAVTGYIISYSVDSQTTWTELVAGPDETSYRVTDLEPGVEVAVRLKAIDAAGNKSVNWSTVATDTPANTDGAVQESVSIVTGGAIESDNFVSGTSGFRLDENSLEIYGDGTLENVSLILGGTTGLNLNTTTEQLWFGASTFADAAWRVDGAGNMRVGGDGDFYADSDGNIWSGNSVMASAPWEITAAGAARFDNVTITGADAGTDATVVNINNNFLVNANLSTKDYTVEMAGDMAVTGSIDLTGTLTADGDVVVVSGDVLKQGYTPGSGTGFKLEGSSGTLYADGAEIAGVLEVTGASTFSGTVTVADGHTIQSGSAGWSILGDGSANFSSVSITGGTLNINSGAFEVTASGVMSATGATVQGTINADDGYLQNMNISGTIDLLSTGLIRSSASGSRVEYDDDGLRFYDTDGTSLLINLETATGDATFSGALSGATGDFTGEITATSGTIDGNLTVAGALEMGVDGVIRTGPTSGRRIEIADAWRDEIRFFTGDVNEQVPGTMSVYTTGVSGSGADQGSLSIASPELDDGFNGAILYLRGGRNSVAGVGVAELYGESQVVLDAPIVNVNGTLDINGNIDLASTTTVSSSGRIHINSGSTLYLDSESGSDIRLREGTANRQWYDASLNSWRWWPDGTERMRLQGNDLKMLNNTRLILSSGNLSSPALKFSSDTNSGFRLDSNGDWRAVVNGSDAMQFSNQIAIVNRDLRPDANNARDCGMSSHGWDVVWRYGEASPSDPSIKQDVTDVDAESSANVLRSFRDIGIKEYRYNNSKRGESSIKNGKAKKKSHDDKKKRRKHRGVMAPDLKEKLSGVVEEDMLNNYVMEPEPDLEGSTWGVSYTATIPDIINVVADLLDRIEELEKEKRNANV